MICAALVAIACQSNGECRQEHGGESLSIPQFFWVDIAAKTLGEGGPDGQIWTGAIQSRDTERHTSCVQGSRDLAWSGTISKQRQVLRCPFQGSSAMVVMALARRANSDSAAGT